MAVLLTARVDRSSGWATLHFPFNWEAKEALKLYPGVKWDPERRCWYGPKHVLPALARDKNFKLEILEGAAFNTEVTLPESLAERLKPYQVEAAKRFVQSPGYLLTFDPRLGKTVVAITSLCAMFEWQKIQLGIVVYPASVSEEWVRQLKEWAGVDLYMLKSHTPLLGYEIDELRQRPYLVVGCHYEILSNREQCLARIVEGRKYALIADEIHMCQNRKATRTATLKRLAMGEPIIKQADQHGDEIPAEATAVARWGLTGTPMRNRPKNLWTLFDFVLPWSMGGYWTFSKRYADAHQNEEGFWTDNGSSNQDELAVRLKEISYRLTRAEAAPWLPKSDRKIIQCAVPESQLKKYRQLEKVYATKIGAALEEAEANPESREILRQLTHETSMAKIPAAIERVKAHLMRSEPDYPIKVICFGHHHETMKELHRNLELELFDPEFLGDRTDPFPLFEAGGWLGREERLEAIKNWKASPEPSVLVANSLSSGIGIDLSDAETALFLELEWVPADLAQTMDRIQDVHLGKRKSPPLYEFLIVKGTIDQDMAGALLHKYRNVFDIVGGNAEDKDMSKTIREAGIVGADRLALPNTDKETVRAALNGLRDRLMQKSVKPEEENLAAEAAGLDDEESTGEETEEDLAF